ncbi:hypothetical protein B9G55_12815 [Saccharibacillus sp. O16]|nr:hypothetical protein B9G55_12815 [Saccharibacillus sp. O16]
MSIDLDRMSQEIIEVGEIFFAESNSYIYVPETNGLFEVDDNIKAILSSKDTSILDMKKMLPTYLEDQAYYDLIDSLKENKLINCAPRTINTHLESKSAIKALTLMMVQECNLKCTYCYAGDGEYNERGKMDFQTAKQAVDYLIKASGDREEITIIFFGGEPLLNFKVIEKLVPYANQEAVKNNKKLSYSMTCNGTLLSKKITDFISKYNIAVQISVDGNKESHDRNRFYGNKTGSYEVILEKTAELRSKHKLGVRSTITPENKDYSNIYEHLFSLNFKSAYVAPAMQMFDESEFIKLSEEYDKLAEFFLNLVQNKKYVEAKKINNIMKFLQRLHEGYESTYACGAELNFLAVDINGDLYPCHRFVNNKNYKQGNVFSGLNEIRKSEFLNEAHTLNRTNCKECWARNLCGGGCHHENYEISGEIATTPSHYCALTKKQLESTFKLYLQLSEEEREKVLG